MRLTHAKRTLRFATALTASIVAGCGGSDSKSAGTIDVQSLAGEIPVLREGCTPFGAPPRTVLAPLDTVFAPSCVPGGRRLDQWSDGEGTVRDACVFEPAAAATDHKLPLVIYLHPSLVGTDLSLDANFLRSEIDTADLTGDPERPGFILLSPYGRVTDRYYPFPDDNASPGWDNWYRQMLPDGQARRVNGESWPANVEAASIDHFVDAIVAEGKVDPQRIYVMGWSNGSAMAMLYALNRPEVAAAAVYSAPDPFAAFNDPCTQQPVSRAPVDDSQLQLFNPDVPILHIHNDCDIAGLCPNGLYLRDTLAAGGATLIDDRIIDSLLQPAEACLDLCGTDPLAYYGGIDDPSGYIENLPGYSLGLANHLRWPYTNTADMFEFLKAHPRR